MSDVSLGLPLVVLAVVVGVLVYGTILVRKYLDRREKLAARAVLPNQISLQVPDSVKLQEMSEKEIEALALDMSRKAAGALPSDSILATDQVTLTNRAEEAGLGILIGWSRSCDSGQLDRGVVIDPDVFKGSAQKVIQENVGKKVQIDARSR